MAIAPDQITTPLVQKVGTSGSTLGITFSATPAVNSLILVPISLFSNDVNGASTLVSVVDNQGNGTYNVLTQVPTALLSNQVHLAYVKAVNASGTFSITLTFDHDPLQAYIQMGCLSFTGITNWAIDQSNKNALGTGNTALTLTTGTTTSANELVVAVMHLGGADANFNSAQNAAGYTNIYKDDDGTVVAAHRTDYKVVSAMAAQTTDWSFDSAYVTGLIATFAGSGSGSPPMFRGS